MTRASGTTRGSAVSRPGTSFHSDTSRAPSARPSSVAVRSEPPRPSVATARSPVAAPRVVLDVGAADETGHDRHLAGGDQRLQLLARRRVGEREVRRRAAERSVGERRSRSRRRTRTACPAAASAAANICADSRSPRLTTKSRVRGVSSFSAARLREQRRQLVDRAVDLGATAAASLPDFPPALPTRAQRGHRDRRGTACAAPRRRPPGRRVRSCHPRPRASPAPAGTSVIPAGADTTTTGAPGAA